MPARMTDASLPVERAADRPLLGMILMLCFCVMAPLGDSIAKILGATIPLLFLVTVRFALQALLLLPLVWLGNQNLITSRRIYRLTFIRTVLHILGVGSMFLSLRYLPLADAIAIAFVMPFILLLLGRFVLDEEVGTHRLMACVLGFAGTLLVIQPSFDEVGYPALIPLFVAVNFAFFMLVTRQIAKDIDPISMQAISGLMAMPLMLIVYIGVAVFGDLEQALVIPSAVETGLLFAIGVLGTLAHLVMTWSLRFAPSATLAPMQYLEIPMATIIGWLIFNDLPNDLAALGIVITVVAGLYVIYREQVSGKRVRT